MKLKLIAFIGAVAGVVVVASSAVVAHSTGDVRDLRVFPADSWSNPSITQSAQGGLWQAGRTTNNFGEQCTWVKSPVGWRTRSCVPPARLFTDGPIYVETTRTDDVSLILGIVRPEVARVRLVRSDCSVANLDVSTDRLFLNVDTASAASPHKLVALNGRGESMNSQVVRGKLADLPHSGDC